MAAEDELALPEVPEAQPEDPEDVSWALSTAEAMWARGDHLEGIKWVRKAAEAASDAEDDERALALAKAASELTSLIARRSRVSIGDGPGYAGGAPPEPPAPTAPQPISSQPVAPPAPATPSKPPPMNKSAPPAPAGRSVPPIPLPSRASSPPKAPQAPQAPQAGRSAPPRPLATSDARQGPQAGRGILSNRTVPGDQTTKMKARRRSRENLDAEAKASGALDTAPQTVVDSATADKALGLSGDDATAVGMPAPSASTRAKRRSRPDPDPTVIGKLDDLVSSERQKSAAEWDALPTQNLSGDDMEHMNAGDRKTTAFAIPVASPVSAPPLTPRAASALHDPAIQTSQAVRVVVWRDGNGVHVAPAGTVVSSITIDAVLVVLEPSADLTAWLSQRER